MKNGSETEHSFYASAILSPTKMQGAIELSTREYDFHKMNGDFVDFRKLRRESPKWFNQNDFQRLKAVASLGGLLFWAKLLQDMEYPQEELVRQDLLFEKSDTYINAAHEMKSRSQGFENTPLMFAVAAAIGEKVGRYIKPGQDEEGHLSHIPPAVATVRAGKDLGSISQNPLEYYNRIVALFPAQDARIDGSAWQYLWQNGAFEADGKRCPGSGLTKVILERFGATVATEQFRNRILEGK